MNLEPCRYSLRIASCVSALLAGSSLLSACGSGITMIGSDEGPDGAQVADDGSSGATDVRVPDASQSVGDASASDATMLGDALATDAGNGGTDGSNGVDSGNVIDGGNLTDGGSSNDSGPTDAGSDNSSSCPAQEPGANFACSGSIACQYGQTTCCEMTVAAATCRCDQGTFSCTTFVCNIACVADSGTNAEAGSGDCTATTCSASEICVQARVSGGAIVTPNDAGACPAQWESDGKGGCVRIPTNSCATRPSGCGNTPTCACAGSLCPSRYGCIDGGTATFVSCQEDVP